ncbi:zinc finger protein ZFAT isoform X2 [Halichoeres trimaculatus]|uniref:zinc finger protein ZFAT isoform X2 n=1 Tax=Halichoeres trimaculatus TaxID=147232 RepID=UPI003D9DF204
MMGKQNAAGSVFMCRLCNLFSPIRSQLLAHCSQLHPEQEPPDDIISALQPLSGGPQETLTESPVKRKRGRPKGSKKRNNSGLSEGNADATGSPETQGAQREGVEKKKEAVRECDSKEGDSHDETLGLECRNCHRSFGNRRQILKHICLKKEEEEEEDVEEDESVGGQTGAEGSGSLDPGGVDSNQKQRNTIKPAGEKERPNPLPLRTNRSYKPKEGGQTTGKTKPLISVFLAEDETLPGVTKMVPVEENSPETGSTNSQAQPQMSTVLQDQSTSLTSEPSACENPPETNKERSVVLTPAKEKTTTSRGFQEYSIKQDAHSLQQSQLKVFACEFCNKLFKFKHTLVAHLRTHTHEKPFQCPHCDYASAIKANLNIHLRKHTGEKFSCPHCPFACLSRGHLKVHIERVHMKVKQHCSFCESKYSDVKNLLKHMEKWHNLKDPAVQQSYQQLRLKTRQGLRQLLYHCPTCKRRFKNQLERERHLLVHGPQRPFSCLLCDYAATRMSTLAAHVRKHLFLYVCCECDEKFVSSHRLKSHLEETHPELDQEAAFTDSINNSFCLTQAAQNLWEEGEREDIEEGRMNKQGIEQEGEDEECGGNDEEEAGGEGKGMEVTASEDRKQGEEEGNKLQDDAVQEEQGIERENERKGELENRDVHQEMLHPAVAVAATASVTRQDEQENMADSCTPALENNTDKVLPSERKTQENTHTAEDNTGRSSSPENTHLNGSSLQTPQGKDAQTSHSDKASEVSHESAFQQVLSSLQKTRLNVESFQQLRKIYGELECQYCGKLFMYKVHYNIHVRTHTKEHSHYCSKCSFSTITKSSLKRHQMQKHSDMLLTCSHSGCEYNTPDKYRLQVHMKTHVEKKKSVTCPVCQQSYPEHRLKHHIKISHPGKEHNCINRHFPTFPLGQITNRDLQCLLIFACMCLTDAQPSQGTGLMARGPEKCPYCDSYFVKSSSDFQRHIWAHQGIKPYNCTVCEYATCNRSNLKAHMNQHNTERGHLCDLCGKKFKSKVSLKSHRLSHTDEGKRFQCSECDFTSVFKPYLLRHMEQHAEFKPFRCAHCHYSCNIAGPLKRHYKLKHPDQKYQNIGPGLPDSEALKQQGGIKCPECEYVYGTKWELNRHLKSKHSLKVVEGTWEVGEAVEAEYVTMEDGEQLTELPVEALQENVDIQQITEFNSETQEAVTSMVAMAPGTVTVVQQLQVADEQEVGECSNQLMVVNADGDLTGDQVMVVEDTHGLEALTVLTQGDSTHHYIVYVQEHTVEIN